MTRAALVPCCMARVATVVVAALIVAALIAPDGLRAEPDGAACIELARKQPFPLAQFAQIHVRVDVASASDEARLRYEIASTDDYLRLFRVYVGGERVLARIVRTRAKGWLDLRDRIAGPGSYEITFQLNAGNFRPWVLHNAVLAGATGTVRSHARARPGRRKRPCLAPR